MLFVCAGLAVLPEVVTPGRALTVLDLVTVVVVTANANNETVTIATPTAVTGIKLHPLQPKFSILFYLILLILARPVFNFVNCCDY